MKFGQWVRVYDQPDGQDPIQDDDGLLLPDGPEAQVRVEGAADVQDGMRSRRGPEVGPFTLERDADVFLRQEELVRQVEAGMAVVVTWGTDPDDPEARTSTATVVGTRELDGRIHLDWVSR